MKTRTFATGTPVSPPATKARAVLQAALSELIRVDDPYPPISRASARLFTPSDDNRTPDWDAETAAWSALQIAVASLDLTRVREAYCPRVRSWWSSASTEARRQVVKIALGICER